MSKNNKQAYARGRRVATIWKRLKKVVSTWDRSCVTWAKNHKLPAWIGHIPIFTAVLGSLAGIVLGGAMIAGCLIFIWAIAYIVQHIRQCSVDNVDSENNSQATSEFRNGDQGYGLYSGPDNLVTSHRMDIEEE